MSDTPDTKQLAAGLRVLSGLVRSGQWAKLSDAERAVMGVYCAYADRLTGECWPGTTTLAREAGLTPRAVKLANARLVDRGLIARRQQGGNGDRIPAVTTLMLSPVNGDAPVNQHAEQPVNHGSPVNGGSRDRCTTVHPTGERGFTGPVNGGSPKPISRTHQMNLPVEPSSLFVGEASTAVDVSEKEKAEEPPAWMKADPFKAAWAEWEQHRREIRKPIKPTSAKAQLETLADMGEARAIAAIKRSIAAGWQGIFEQDQRNGAQHGKPRTAAERGEFPEPAIDIDKLILR